MKADTCSLRSFSVFALRSSSYSSMWASVSGKVNSSVGNLRKNDTEYGMGWLPLGGYCKISGMIDESFDTDQMKQEPQPWEFRTKPAWQRLLIMIGGVLVNFLLALFIYSMVMFVWGDSYFKVSDMNMGMRFNAEAKALGFKDHDVMLGTDQGAFREYCECEWRFLPSDSTGKACRRIA